MISRIHGKLLEKQAPWVIIDVRGVGYELSCPMTVFYDLPEIGDSVTLHTHFAVREDHHALYGFRSVYERALFRTLIKVNGVGPKLALAILSSIDAATFAQCVMESDTTTLVRIPGVGKKTAERLVIEMKDRLKDIEGSGAPTIDSMQRVNAATIDDDIADAQSALIALGYKAQDANKAIKSLDTTGKTSEMLIREALQNMVTA